MYVFWPLLRGINFFILLIFFFSLQSAFTAFRMEIPPYERLIKKSGYLGGPPQGYRKSNEIGIKIKGDDGVRYSCNCGPAGKANCFSDIDYINRKYIVALAGKKFDVWMYPSNAFIGADNVCYQLSSEGEVYRSYAKSVEEYRGAKSGVTAFFWWLYVFCVFSFVFIRSFMFIWKISNGKSEC